MPSAVWVEGRYKLTPRFFTAASRRSPRLLERRASHRPRRGTRPVNRVEGVLGSTCNATSSPGSASSATTARAGRVRSRHLRRGATGLLVLMALTRQPHGGWLRALGVVPRRPDASAGARADAPSRADRAATGRERHHPTARVDFSRRPVDRERRVNACRTRHAGRAWPGDRRRSVVYLDPAPRAAFDAREEPHARLDQRDETFVPHVLAIVAGHAPSTSRTTTAPITTSSRSRRRAASISAATPPGTRKSIRFDRPGIVRVFCDIHSHMSAFILVFAHRYFAVTDDDGRYHIDNVPPGTYNVVAWNEAMAQRVAARDGARRRRRSRAVVPLRQKR